MLLINKNIIQNLVAVNVATDICHLHLRQHLKELGV